ncbi:hypothetical protein H0H87_005812 [Tephrocybe sp. NHM501043]|nr:hypothetical protein H0H87_005812 [Tephrocybe sp. NHM501043]
MGFANLPVFVKYGDTFRLYRKWFKQHFDKGQVSALRLIELREARILAQSVLGNPRRQRDFLVRYSTSIVIEVAYGHRITSDDDPYVKLAEDVCERAANSGPPGVRHFPSWFPGAYYAAFARDSQQTVRNLYEYPLNHVTDLMAKGEAKPSFLEARLREFQSTSSDIHREGSLEKAQAASAALYIAGAETTSASLSFFLLAMLLHPECQTTAQMEIDSIIGQDRLPDFNDRTHLPYVECLLQETLRWNNAAPSGVPHRSMEDDVYNGMFIPRGSIIIPNTRGMTWDESIYQDPFSFDPSRFLPRPMGREEPFPVGPFGFGRRKCPGQYVGEDSMWIAIVTMLATLVVSNEVDDDGKEIMPDSMPITSGISSHPRPFQFRAEARTETARMLLEQAQGA